MAARFSPVLFTKERLGGKRKYWRDCNLGIAVAGVCGSESGSNPTHIKLEGPSDSLLKFFAEYLSEDSVEGVYQLVYPENSKG